MISNKKRVLVLLAFTIIAMADAQNKYPVKTSFIEGYGASFYNLPEPSKTEVVERIDKSFIPPKSLDEQTLAKHLRVFENSFYFYLIGETKDIAKALALSYGEHLLPNYTLLNKTDTINTPIVEKVITKKGANVFIKQKNNDLFPGDIPIQLTPVEEIDYAEGTLHLKIPTAYKELEVQLYKLNQTITAEGISVKAIAQNNDVVTLSASANLPFEYAIKAKNKNNDFLASKERTTLPEKIYNEYIKNNKFPNELIQDYVTNPLKYENESKIISIKSTGVAMSVIIYIPIKFIDKKIQFKALQKPDFFSEEIAISRNQYEQPQPAVIYKNISKADLEQSITPKADRSQALLMGYNNHMVTIQLPTIGNSKFADVKMEKATTYKNNQPVKFKGQGPFLNSENYTCSFRFEEDVPWGKKSNPLDIDKMQGEFVIEYPLNVKQIKITRTDKKNATYFTNNNTVKFYWQDADSIQTNAITIKAYNNEFDYPLESMNSTTAGNFELQGEYVNFLENKFLGNVDYFTVDIAEQYTTIVVPFTLTPIAAREQPKLPKREGK